MLAEALSRWLAGEDVHLVAPFRSPEEILPEPTRCLVLLPTDLEATIWAAAVGGAALLRVSARAQRDRLRYPVRGKSGAARES